ncbi:hypothetical protein CC2G_009792 [Coprinopsis cinerea AmutBmut pab1-1]|nr:hypothetical protein CC2G_009792 [Coprinopsis cinerea AmutBmut pab1-1]
MSSSLYSVHKRLPSNHHHAMENRSHDNLNRTGGIPALIDVSDSESDIGGRESPGIMTLGGDVESVRRRPANGTRPATLDEGEPMGSGGVGDPPRERDGRSIENRRPHLANSPAHADASMTAPSPGAYAGGTIAGDHASNTAAPVISGVPLYLGGGRPLPSQVDGVGFYRLSPLADRARNTRPLNAEVMRMLLQDTRSTDSGFTLNSGRHRIPEDHLERGGDESA